MVQLSHGLILDKIPLLSRGQASIHARSVCRSAHADAYDALYKIASAKRHINTNVITFLVMSGILSTKSPKNMTFSYTLPSSGEEMRSAEVNED